MATVIKKISELEHLEELTSSSNVIIEENGEAKRFSAASLGKVKTVNGVEPDENGNIEVEVPDVEIPEINYPVTSVNGQTGDVVIEVSSGSSVQADMAQNDPDQPDYVKNRTHWVEGSGATIEWDGSTEDRDSFVCNDNTYYKIADVVPTESEVIGGTQIITTPDGDEEVQISSSEVSSFTGGFAVLYAAVIQNTEGSIDGASYTAPSTGVYSILVSGNIYVSSFTYGSTTYHPLDEGFIPDTVARKSDIPEVNYPVTSVNGMTGDVVIEGGSGGGVTSWNDLEDKPFYEEEGKVAVVESQSIARTDAFENFTTYELGIAVDISAGDTCTVSIDGVETTLVAEEDNGGVRLGASSLDFTEANFLFSIPSSGSPILYLPADGAESVTLAIYTAGIVVYPMDEKYIPDSIVRAGDVIGVIRWDGNTEGKDIVDLSGDSYSNDFCDETYMLVHVSDEAPKVSQLVGAVMRVTERDTGETTTTVLNNTGRFVSTLDDNTYQIMNGYNHVVCYVSLVDNNEWYSGQPFKKGIYFVSTSNEFMSLLDYNSKDINKISEAYIPEVDVHENQIIEWNNVTSGLHYETVGDVTMYMASVLTPEYADIIGAKVTVLDTSTGEETVTTVLEEDVEQFDGGYFAGDFAVISRNGAVYSEITWDFAGLYVARYSSTQYVKSIEFSPAVTRTVVEEIRRMNIKLTETYAEATKIHSWNDVTDKPFVIENGSITIEYDGSTSDRDSIKMGNTFYKVSDGEIPDGAVLDTITAWNGSADNTTDGSSYAVTYGEGATEYGSYILDIRNTTFVLDGTTYTAPSTGIYYWRFVYNSNTMYVKSATFTYRTETLKKECLPKAAALADAAGDAPTAAEFNALLAALRSAGYLAT